MTPRDCEIVDCGAFCEVIFFCISRKNPLGDFFDSLARNHVLELKYMKIKSKHLRWVINIPDTVGYVIPLSLEASFVLSGEESRE